MAIIDRDGLFHGDRLRRCSDTARLWWPYLFLAANGFGRFELNYTRLTTEAFAGFACPPTEESLWGLIAEYRKAHLLFLYECGGQIWGQWWCKPGSLPRYQTNKDRESPEPPTEEFTKWLSSYRKEVKPLPKILENLPKSFGNISSGVGVGNGVGNGVGVGKEQTPTPPKNGGASHWRKVKFEEFWESVWKKLGGRDAAWKAFERKAKTPEDADRIIAASKLQGPSILAHAEQHNHSILHPATWLNQGRYDDEPTLAAPKESDADRWLRLAEERDRAEGRA